jgi:hypothetical protein
MRTIAPLWRPSPLSLIRRPDLATDRKRIPEVAEELRESWTSQDGR